MGHHSGVIACFVFYVEQVQITAGHEVKCTRLVLGYKNAGRLTFRIPSIKHIKHVNIHRVDGADFADLQWNPPASLYRSIYLAGV